MEVLCPGPLKVSAKAGATGTAASAKTAPASVLRTASPPREPRYPPVCGGQAQCTEVSVFAATVTSFRTSVSGRDQIATATLRFQNKTKHPLILGYVDGSGVATDDQGNRFAAYGPAVRGIGLIANRTVDPKFVLQPGETSDGRFDFGWRQTGGKIIGTRHDVELTIREIRSLANGQYELGQEYAIRFAGLDGRAGVGSTGGSSYPSETPLHDSSGRSSAPSPDPVPVSGSPDACAGRARCYSAGPFVAEVINVTASPYGRHHLAQFNIKFRNLTTQPLILAYKSGSGSATDNYNNLYACRRPGTHDTSVQGIGMWEGAKVDPSFTLAPGESRNAVFGVMRYNASPPLGRAFNYDVVIAQMEVLANGQQIRTTREYSVTFQNLVAGAAMPSADNVGDAVKKLGDMFKKKQH